MFNLLMPMMISLKTTGLQFGYFFGLLFFILFVIRGIREEKLSDIILGLVMFFMAMLLQDYTFGFEGINYLWEELDGWPRHFPWLFPASVYFYFLAQTNVHFGFTWKHLYHLIPYFFYVGISIVLLFLGLTPQKGLYNSSIGVPWEIFLYVLNYGGIFYYFTKALKIYRNYKSWAENQYSNIYEIELKWLRNFLIFFLIGAIIHLFNTIVDVIYNLPYDQDYYWQLFTVITIVYVGISGFNQKQEKNIAYEDMKEVTEENKEKTFTPDELIFKEKLKGYMESTKPFLNPDLTLRDLALKMNTNTTFLSGIINNHFEKNFNDYINEYRAFEFQKTIKDPSSRQLTLVAIAYDCGFNSKATFQRAIKKFTGKIPSEL
ncbi:MAG: helix-turn-helix transcriptional regulator [Saprospiraceae bacterium]|nr:helix-turn-helix transcriptional regulator [Saprospiraceae bacterium]